MQFNRLPSIWLFVLAAVACQPAPPAVTGEPGAALPGLTPADSVQFLAGQALFNRPFAPEDGLGPLFNQARCSSCHDLPTSGGAGAETVLKSTRFEDGRCDLLEREGGDNIQRRATPLLQAHGIFLEAPPPGGNARVDVNATALYGLGLVESVPDETLAALADPDDRDGDGVSGRLAATPRGSGRFGRKADMPGLRAFIEGALLFELGLTSPGRSEEEGVNGMPLPAGVDPAPDPEVDEVSLVALVDYVRFLAPPSPAVMSSRAMRDTVEAGEELFESVGCAGCHVPRMITGPNANPALDRKEFAPYSDFLLHDLGPEMRGVCSIDASPTEYRTAPLMGVRLRPSLLFDAGAASVDQAVQRHGGEAARSRDRYRALPPPDRAALLRFLSTR